MGGCLKSCCGSEAGLRCHSVLTGCGLFYFLFMFLLFDRQKPYFQFHVPDAEGTKWSCLFSALIFLIWLIVIIIRLSQLQKAKVEGKQKAKISLASEKELNSFHQDQEKMGINKSKNESERLLAQ